MTTPSQSRFNEPPPERGSKLRLTSLPNNVRAVLPLEIVICADKPPTDKSDKPALNAIRVGAPEIFNILIITFPLSLYRLCSLLLILFCEIRTLDLSI